MLAKTLSERQRESLPEEIFVQPKLDGIRCLTNGRVFYSRLGNPLEVPARIKADIEAMLKRRQIPETEFWWDGELYIHGESFQTIQSALKNLSRPHPKRDQIRYFVYDAVSTLPQDDRFEYLSKYRKLIRDIYKGSDKLPSVRFLSTHRILKEEIDDYLRLFEKEGYEGLIARWPDAPYVNKRSTNLLKLKTFKEDDFMIIAVKEGKGKNEGTAIFTCRVAKTDLEAEINDETFDVTAPGTYEEKADHLNDNRIGRYLTVKYQELTDDGIPRFPIALGIKEDR